MVVNSSITDNRRDYLYSQKTLGRHLLGVFPAFSFPRELIWSFNILPVEIWDPPLIRDRAQECLQPYICSIVHQGLELILSGQADLCDAFLFLHTCDSIQNLASLVQNYIGQKRHCYFLYQPKAFSLRKIARSYYLAQLKHLVMEMTKEGLGNYNETQLIWAVKQGQEITRLINKIYALRAAGKLTTSASEFYRVLRRGEWLWPDEYYIELHKLLTNGHGQSARGPRVILSGVLPNPAEILIFLDKIGAIVAHDDFLNCGRRLLFPLISYSDNPWDILIEQYFSLSPCFTRSDAISVRRDYILQLAHVSKADGIIFLLVKFCEPGLFEIPILVKELKAAGLSVLILEVEVNEGLSEQITTRIEAFLEMIS